jgi:hypothetical protein
VIDTQQVSTGYNGKQKKKDSCDFVTPCQVLGILFLPPQNVVSQCKVCFVFWMNFWMKRKKKGQNMPVWLTQSGCGPAFLNKIVGYRGWQKAQQSLTFAIIDWLDNWIGPGEVLLVPSLPPFAVPIFQFYRQDWEQVNN